MFVLDIVLFRRRIVLTVVREAPPCLAALPLEERCPLCHGAHLQALEQSDGTLDIMCLDCRGSWSVGPELRA